MKKVLLLVTTLIMSIAILEAKPKTITLKFIETTDVHGSFFPVNYMSGKPTKGSMACVSTYVKQQRAQYGKNLILLENGDILQGQPTNYLWNFINTKDENIASTIVNYLGYDAQAFGNHDIETAHPVYDKWISELRCPVLGANVVRDDNGEPYTKPYEVIERDGVRIVVLGMLTSAIPSWLSKDIWSGIHFEEMVASSQKWVKLIRETEHPDILIGLFHSGRKDGIVTANYEENVSERIAREVPGFDIIFYGHDHQPYCAQVKNVVEGSNTWIIDPANNAHNVGEATVSIVINKGKILSKSINASLVSVDDVAVDKEYMEFMKGKITELQEFTTKKIGVFDKEVRSRDGFFGSSALNDLVLNLELDITGADIAFNAPLLFNAVIKKGDVTMADMFNLYKYENKLYVMRMTGREILGHLNMSYDKWVNQMKSPDDHILLLKNDGVDDGERNGFLNPFFNFDSAAGINYEVDVTKPAGEKVHILSMANGEPFDLSTWYNVALNSYRGNGGGELITLGAGIPHDSIDSRIIYRSELDQRYYLMKEIEKRGTISPKPNNNWRFVPEEWAKPALARDRKLLFGGE